MLGSHLNMYGVYQTSTNLAHVGTGPMTAYCTFTLPLPPQDKLTQCLRSKPVFAKASSTGSTLPADKAGAKRDSCRGVPRLNAREYHLKVVSEGNDTRHWPLFSESETNIKRPTSDYDCDLHPLTNLKLPTSAAFNLLLLHALPMPHRSSRRREVKDQLHPTKLSHEVDDDGWSHVVRKSSAPSYVKSHTQSTQSTDITRIHVDFTEQLTPAQVDFLRRNIPRHALKSTEIRPRAAIYSPEELQKRFGQVQTAWSQDTVVQRLRAVLTRVGVAPTADKEHANKEESLHKDELDSKDADERPVHDEASVGHAVDVTNQLNDLSLKAETSRPIPEESTESGQAYSGLDKAICIGLGSPSADTSAWEKNVLWQLVAFLEMAKICMYRINQSSRPIML